MPSTFTSLVISTFSPFPSLSLSLPSSTPICSLSSILAPLCPPSQQTLSLASGRSLPSSDLPLSTLTADDSQPGQAVFLRLGVRLPGGKGGFASQLRAQGGRMSSNRATNNDSCRDLNGRRLSTIKEAQKLAAYLEAEPNRQAAAAKATQAKLDALNEEIAKLDALTSNGKRRLDDSAYVEESRKTVETVKDAVREAMLAKRKKAKLAASSPAVENKDEKAGANAADKVPAKVAPLPTAAEETPAEAPEAVAGEEENVAPKKKAPIKAKGKGKK